MTEFGKIDYIRRYYLSKSSGEYRYLAEDRLGIKKYQRIDRSLESKLINMASEESYNTVGKEAVDDLELRGQTVLNKVRKLGEVENDELNDPEEKSEVKCNKPKIFSEGKILC